MCLGTPMQIQQCLEHTAHCVYKNQIHHVDISLVGPQANGTWVLVFLGDARQVLSDNEAQDILQALEAVDAVMNGDNNIDHLFADLVDREPQLPAHLKHQ